MAALSKDLSLGLDQDLSGDLGGGDSDPLLSAIVASGALEWVDPRTEYITFNGANVETITGRLAGYEFTNLDTIRQPAHAAVGPSLTGVPSLDFSGGGLYWLTTTDTDLAAAANGTTFTMLAAYRSEGGGQETIAAACDASSSYAMRQLLVTTSTTNYTSAGVSAAAPATTNLGVNVDGWALAQSTAVDTHTIATSTAPVKVSVTSTQNMAGNLDIFGIGRRETVGKQQYFQGELFALILWADTPSDAAMAAVIDALQDYVGIGLEARLTRDPVVIAGQSNGASLGNWVVNGDNVAVGGSLMSSWAQGQPHYDAMLAAIEAEAAGVVWIYWVHGEDDSATVPLSTAYEAALNAMITALEGEASLSAYTLRWVIGELHEDLEPTTYPESATVRAALLSVAAGRANVYTDNFDDLDLRVDLIHYETADLETRRQRYDATRMAN